MTELSCELCGNTIQLDPVTETEEEKRVIRTTQLPLSDTICKACGGSLPAE